MPIVLIQPHPDDLAYSIGGCIIKKMFGPDPLAITVFSRSESTKKPIDNVSEVRKNEDKAYFKSVGIRHIDLDLPDSSIRPFDYSMDTLVRVKNELHKIIPPCADVFVPMAIGYHIDHLIVREASRNFKNKTYYEDIPYSFRYNPNIEKDMKLLSINISDVVHTKVARLGLYESQMDENTVKQVLLKNTERMWYYEPFI